MLQLVYTSTAADAWDGDLHALSVQAASNNTRDEITGILLCHERTFLQAIEGPQVHVEDTFIRIIQDVRHHSLHMLSRRMLTAREFGDWAMAELTTREEKTDAIALVRSVMTRAEPGAQAIFQERFNSDRINGRSAHPVHPDQANRFAARGHWTVARPLGRMQSDRH